MEGASWWNERLWNSQPREESCSWVPKIQTQNNPSLLDRIISTDASSSAQSGDPVIKIRERPQTGSYKKTANSIAYPNALLQSTLQRPVISSLRPGTAGRSRPLGTLRIFYLSKPLSVKESQNIHHRSAEERQWVVDSIDSGRVDCCPSPHGNENTTSSNQTTPRTRATKPVPSQKNSDDEESTIFEDLSVLNPQQFKNGSNTHVYRNTPGRRASGLPPSNVTNNKRRVASATVRQRPQQSIFRKTSYPQVYRSSPWNQYRMHTESEESRDQPLCSTSIGNNIHTTANEFLQSLKLPSNGNTTGLGSRTRSSFSLNNSTVPCLSVSPITFQLAKTPRIIVPKRTTKPTGAETSGFYRAEPTHKDHENMFETSDKTWIPAEAPQPKVAHIEEECRNSQNDATEIRTKAPDATPSTKVNTETQSVKERDKDSVETDASVEFWETTKLVRGDVNNRAVVEGEKQPPEVTESRIETKPVDEFASSNRSKYHSEEKDTLLIATPQNCCSTDTSNKPIPRIRLINGSMSLGLDRTSLTAKPQESHGAQSGVKNESSDMGEREIKSVVPMSESHTDLNVAESCVKQEEEKKPTKPRSSAVLSQNWMIPDTKHKDEAQSPKAARSEGVRPNQLMQNTFLNAKSSFPVDSTFLTQKASELNLKLTMLNKKASVLEQQLLQSRVEKAKGKTDEARLVETKPSAAIENKMESNVLSQKEPVTIAVHLQHASFSSEKPNESSSEEGDADETCGKKLEVQKKESAGDSKPEKPKVLGESGSSLVNQQTSIEKELLSDKRSPTDVSTIEITSPKALRTSNPIQISKVIDLITNPVELNSIPVQYETEKLASPFASTDPGEEMEQTKPTAPSEPDEPSNPVTTPLKSILKRSCLSGRSLSTELSASAETGSCLGRSALNRWAIYSGQQSSTATTNTISTANRYTSLRRPLSAQTSQRIVDPDSRAGGTASSGPKSPRNVGATRRSTVRFDMKNNLIFEFHPFDIVQTSFSSLK